MRRFVLVAASVVVVDIMAAVFECTRAFLKANGDFSIPKALWNLTRLMLPAAQWLDVQAANSVAVASTCLLVYILYYMRLIRTDDMYGRKFGVFLVLYDIAMLFLFMSLARSTTNLATKSVVAEDTSWALAILVFLLLALREVISYLRPGRSAPDDVDRFQKIRFYLTIGIFCVASIAFLSTGRSQARYVFDLRSLLRDASWVGAVLTATAGVACWILERARHRAAIQKRRDVVPLCALLSILCILGLLVLICHEHMIKVMIENRVYYAGGALPLLVAVIGVPYLIWLDTSILRDRGRPAA